MLQAAIARMRNLTSSPGISHGEAAKLFVDARTKLNVSQRELAELLNTSLYAVVRWERGDLEPAADARERLDALLRSGVAKPRTTGLNESRIFFPSTGIRQQSVFRPLLDRVDVPLLENPRNALLEPIYDPPFWGDGDMALADMLRRHCTPAVTSNNAITESISAGKNTYTYDAHTYHTKVPPQGIAKVIESYLPEGGLVLDPFGGSGMTAVAARYLGYDVVLNELSPAACFIAHNFTRAVDVNEFNSAVEKVMELSRGIRQLLYTTNCRECDREVEILYTVWSYSLECNHCGSNFVAWDHCRKYGANVREHKLLRRFPCPSCGQEVDKSKLKRLEQSPVFLAYRCCSKSKILEHPLTDQDLMRIEDADRLLAEYQPHIPATPLPNGVNLNQPKRHGIDTVAKLYTPRNLLACAAIWRAVRRIEDPELSAAVGFVFTSLYQRVTRLSEYRFWGGSGNMANFNVPHISNEANAFVTFERKAKSIADHYCATAQGYDGRCAIRTGSATDMRFLPDESVDFIFTDPPFGGNINYSEMNIIWESWLGSFTEPTLEAIVNRHQGKDVVKYEELMARSLKEAFRVLRSGHWMVLVFMNSSERVWRAIRNAIQQSGFHVERMGIFDKQHGTFKQFVSSNAAGADLMIHCRKPKGTDGVRRDQSSGVEIGAEARLQEFLSGEGENVPRFSFLHVRREAEIDYRTLYSRYIAREMKANFPVMGFAKFRQLAAAFLVDYA